MNKYTIYCTEEQVKKAFELGAPINQIPTAEQMIGWLEEKGIVIIFMATMKEDLSGYTWIAHICHFEDKSVWVDVKNLSRKEATLAAIDAALDYLKKREK